MLKAFQSLIYLASPYSHKDANVITKRVLEVQDATARLIEAGHLIFSPIVHSHHIADQVSFIPVHDESTDFSQGNTWLDYDKAMIDKANELWILRLPGHTTSKGVHAELYHALDRGKPVKYINYPELTIYAAIEASKGIDDFGPLENPNNQADGFAEAPECFCEAHYVCSQHFVEQETI